MMNGLALHVSFYERIPGRGGPHWVGFARRLQYVVYGNARLAGAPLLPDPLEFPSLLAYTTHQFFPGYPVEGGFIRSFAGWLEHLRTRGATRLRAFVPFDARTWRRKAPAADVLPDVVVEFADHWEGYSHTPAVDKAEDRAWYEQHGASLWRHRFEPRPVGNLPDVPTLDAAEAELREAAADFARYLRTEVPEGDRDFVGSLSGAEAVVDTLTLDEAALRSAVSRREEHYLARELEEKHAIDARLRAEEEARERKRRKTDEKRAKKGKKPAPRAPEEWRRPFEPDEDFLLRRRYDFLSSDSAEPMLRAGWPWQSVRLLLAASTAHPFGAAIQLEERDLPSFLEAPAYAEVGERYERAAVSALNAVLDAVPARPVSPPLEPRTLRMDDPLELHAALRFADTTQERGWVQQLIREAPYPPRQKQQLLRPYQERLPDLASFEP
ncbi:hypothetical protein HPC49_25350 [Pyxidicoccus fallax]|uniref:Uncharacterized protein n=1 Tax=Pyxidicoccus fallax TaxID=394095 RepID=A0A848LIH1_9BACT|nr:hypothetical protein [Pyxidicoccus fallax]NMO17521.1 hypothetical protein [Pyxidicoccus fallax]NPC81538.1 hypothetical protein [Pyxidicoccus fallax]